MSEDNDRMDRAKRIRQMREGGSQNADGTDDSAQETNAEDEGDAETATGDGSDAAETPSDEMPSEETSSDEPSESSETDRRESANETEKRGDEKERVDDSETGAGGEDEGVKDDSEKADEGDSEHDPSAVIPETADLEEYDSSSQTLESGDDVRAPLPDSGQLEAALESPNAGERAAGEAEAEPTAAPARFDAEEEDEDETRVLEFTLGDEHYCLDINYIEEIVKEETITRVPNTPEYVEGVVDLRGQITTILNPKVTIDSDDATAGDLIIVFDSNSFEDQGHVGWVVDDVRQVSPITDSEVNDAPVEGEYINGVIDREDDDQFVIWTSPEMAMEQAE